MSSDIKFTFNANNLNMSGNIASNVLLDGTTQITGTTKIKNVSIEIVGGYVQELDNIVFRGVYSDYGQNLQVINSANKIVITNKGLATSEEFTNVLRMYGFAIYTGLRGLKLKTGVREIKVSVTDEFDNVFAAIKKIYVKDIPVFEIKSVDNNTITATYVRSSYLDDSVPIPGGSFKYQIGTTVGLANFYNDVCIIKYNFNNVPGTYAIKLTYNGDDNFMSKFTQYNHIIQSVETFDIKVVYQDLLQKYKSLYEECPDPQIIIDSLTYLNIEANDSDEYSQSYSYWYGQLAYNLPTFENIVNNKQSSLVTKQQIDSNEEYQMYLSRFESYKEIKNKQLFIKFLESRELISNKISDLTSNISEQNIIKFNSIFNVEFSNVEDISSYILQRSNLLGTKFLEFFKNSITFFNETGDIDMDDSNPDLDLATQDYIDLMKSNVEQKFDEYINFEESQSKLSFLIIEFRTEMSKVNPEDQSINDILVKAESDLFNTWQSMGYISNRDDLDNLKNLVCSKVYSSWVVGIKKETLDKEYNSFIYVLNYTIDIVKNLIDAIKAAPPYIPPTQPETNQNTGELDPTDPNTLRYDLWITEKPTNYNREVAREILSGNEQFSFNLIESVDSVLDMIDNLFAKDDMGMLKETAITTPIKIMVGQKYTDVQYVRHEFIDRFGEYAVADTTYEKVFFKITRYETVTTQLGFYNLVLTVSKEEDQNVAYNLAFNLVSILIFFEFISNDEENKLYDKIKAASIDGGQVKIINLQPTEALWAVKKYLEINLAQYNPSLEIQPVYNNEQSDNNSNENNNTTTTSCSCCVNGTCGQQGAQGETGPQGIQGEKGEKGERGEQGLQGPEGPQGIQGVQGPQGEKGEKGDTGESGPQGVQGLQGIQGEQGPKGDRGEPGIQGPQGLQGPQGPQGEKGEKGDTGEPGPQGEPGQIQDIESSEYIKQLKASIDALQIKLNDLEAKLNSQLGFIEKIFGWIKEIILGIFGKK